MELYKSVQDHIKAEITKKCLRSYKSVQDYSMELHSMELRSAELLSISNLHSRNTLF